MSIDLLEPLLKDSYEGQTVVGNGETRRGWHVYASNSGGSWVADELHTPQEAHALHLRTADREGHIGGMPTWHRSYFSTHFARPTVYCSFRIDDYDENHHHGGGIGFKLSYLHQDNLTAYHIMLHVDGRAQIYKEARDSSDGKGVSGFALAQGRWTYKQNTRRHLVVMQDEDGTIRVVLDGKVLLEAKDEYFFQSGQIGLRLDGLDARIHSLVVDAPDSWEEPNDVASWAQPAWDWGKSNNLINEDTIPADFIDKQELVVFLQRMHRNL